MSDVKQLIEGVIYSEVFPNMSEEQLGAWIEGAKELIEKEKEKGKKIGMKAAVKKLANSGAKLKAMQGKTKGVDYDTEEEQAAAIIAAKLIGKYGKLKRK